MPQRTKSEILASVQTAIQAASPQVRVDAAKGPFFYLAGQGVAQPLADASVDVERMALLSTLQFPSSATTAEALALARAFGQTVGTGGFATGVAYAVTGRRPVGTDAFTVLQGTVFSTSVNGGTSFAAVESKALTDANADAFYNPSTRRYELPVQVEALTAGVGGNIPPFTITVILGGDTDFDGATNVSAFQGGTPPQDIQTLYARVQQKLQGLDEFSRGGLVSRVINVDSDHISAVSLTYASEFPTLFYRLPDGDALDVWVLDSPVSVLTTDTFVASAGQTQFFPTNRPVLSLSSVFVNGVPAAANLVLDTSLQTGRSTREASYVMLSVPATAGDLVDVTYTYDSVMVAIQADIDGYLNAATGALFATDVLVRYPQSLPLLVTVTGTVLGTFDPNTVESEVQTIVGTYLANGTGLLPVLGGVRSPSELRDLIRSQVPGIATLSIATFGRKSFGALVETVDIPRNAQAVLEDAADLFVQFT